MTSKRALAIGVGRVDPDCYGGRWHGGLGGAERDAVDMAEVARASGFTPVETLPPGKPTHGAVLDGIATAAKAVNAGGFFFLSFSGHGSRLKDQVYGPDSREEPDGFDECWCLYDGVLRDDAIHHALTAFEPDVRVFVVSDSCHSGSVVKRMEGPEDPEDPTTKAMPAAVARQFAATHRGSYELCRRLLAESRREVRASVLLLSACTDRQTTRDGDGNGVFTRAFRDVWQGGAFRGSYIALRDQIEERLRTQAAPREQTPQLCHIGAGPDFRATRVFSLLSDGPGSASEPRRGASGQA